MKLLILFGIIFLMGWLESSTKKPSGKSLQRTIQLNDTIHFTNQIQPILVKNCSPCHFAGGKMYERMPFDKDTTIINHQGGVLKRIKGEENLIIKTLLNKLRSTGNNKY
ncbi:MAG: hypothetical protein E6H08_18105 [Bacteroidetes bacterium]|nr:MAG: hypothetical protein E6H08_18105 [Bacteroidota bacterium]